eukprot:CAMPEP_0182417898 /NCGR_PEP_ID=MMETSP1167-20130531/2347_1 /TAXON_ID=2988 /ORGANISM="Mallomonas Sp, Strain CCMP3275" /LENGTH=335 /DNA_ID=CAMNT_0024591749 /DNA_START=208 /DNA_END=1215 /DNA_ORIENTATION=+
MFNFFGKSKTNTPSTAASAGKAADDKKIKDMKAKLEKVSNKQGRDWKAEAAAAPKPKAEIKDKQLLSYNFKKSNEFPNLYEGWIRASGDQITKQMIKSVKAALSKKVQFIEVLFDPVPNLDEVAFGTVMNKKFRQEVSAELKVPDYATNRGGPSTLEWSNLYWASRLVNGIGSPKAVAISLSGEGTRGKFLPTLPKGMRLLTLAEAKRTLAAGEASVLVLLSPCQSSHYSDGRTLSGKLGVPVIALNAPYSFRYDVGGGSPWELAYVMKRIPKGWIFRTFPGKFQAIIEGPDYEVFQAAQYDKQPTLPVISKASMEASAQKYGAVGNDRIFQQRL